MYKKNKNRKKYIVLVSIIIIIFIALGFTINDNYKQTGFEKVIKSGIYSISNFLSKPFFFIKKNIFSEKKEKYDNDILKFENISLDKEILKENTELKELLELNNTLSEREYINATVINRNVDYWFNEITINKGSNLGIKENMAVITSNGLIGKTIKVNSNTSIIKLLTSDYKKNKISVKIEYEDKFVYGLLSNYIDPYFIVDGISNNTNIEKGAKVTTSGLTDLFPSGILIGYVEEITTDNFELSKTLKVKSDVDFNDIYYVTILKRNVDDNDD